MEKRLDQQTGTEAKTQLIEQINNCLRSGQYPRALDLARSAAAEFPSDAELAELERVAHDGVNRNTEAQRLITESQELFAQRKSTEAIQLLRKAYELDKTNSLARSILANALVEHAHSIVETDWLEAEKLANQALNLNPAHPTAKRILNLILGQKETSPVSDWVSQARKLQSSGEIFAALAWVAEGLAVHPHEPKLLQIQDEIQRDQDARRRQDRRGDLENLRRLQGEIDAAPDVAAKQALAERIQAVAAKYWTDGEVLSIANALLLRLGLTSQESLTASSRGKSAAVILHVPRASAPTAPADASQVPSTQSAPAQILRDQTTRNEATQTQRRSSPVSPRNVTPSISAPRDPLAPPPPAQRAATISAAEAVREPSRQTTKIKSSVAEPKQGKNSTFSMAALVSVAAVVLVSATFYFTRRHYAAPAAKMPEAVPSVSPPPVPSVSAPVASATPVSAPPESSRATSVTAPAETIPESSQPNLPVLPDTAAGKLKTNVQPSNDQPSTESVRNVGTLLVVVGQDDARVFLNGKAEPQLTQAGQLRVPNLDLKDYVVQISKGGFLDPPPQKIRIRKGEQAKLVFVLQPVVRTASLTIQGAAPGTSVLVDQTLVGTVQPNGTLSVSTVNPGDHTVELRKERFKPRQLKKHFVAGETISLGAGDASLEAAPAQLKITFVPADASVAISKGDLPTVIRSGVPLNLAAGTYTLTARTADKITRVSTFEVSAGQSKSLDLSLAPNGMSKWDAPGAWKHEGDSFIRKGGGFVLYGVVPASGTFAFSAMLTKGHFLQWVLNYTDAKNYVLCQMDDNNFYRTVIRNGQKTDEIKVPDKGDKKSFRTLRIRIGPTEIVHQIKHGDIWTTVDHWTSPGANLSLGNFGFYLPGDDQITLSGFAHYADLNIR